MVLLPPVDEVWGKVIFSVACVKNSVHRGRVPGLGVPSPGGVCVEPSPDSYCCGRHASYWNAFLLLHYSL